MPRPANALIVDDEPHVLVLLRGLLKQLGIGTIWEATDGTMALEKADTYRPDVVLLDLNLPPADGLQVLAAIKAKHPSTHVIIVSAQSTVKTFNRARELGAAGYVIKYAPVAEVLRMLSDAFDTISADPGEAAPRTGTPPPASTST